MNIPAFGSEFLRIGRTYDVANPAAAGIDIYPADIPTVKDNRNWFQFEYKVVKNSSDVNKLLDISGELSLKVKAGLVSVQGFGKYLSDSKKEEDTTELLAVLKCFTVIETIDGFPKVLDQVEKNPGLGTHFVRGVSYGGGLVASLTIKSSSDSEKLDIQGSAQGEVKAGAVDVQLSAQLKSLATQCSSLSDIAIKYYATELPPKVDTSLDGLVKLIEEFPLRLAKSDHPEGVPLKFALLPINNAIPTAKPPLQGTLSHAAEEAMVKRFDDLCRAQDQVNQYLESSNNHDDNDVLDFSEEIENVMGQFKDAINSMGSSSGKDSVDACLEAYKKALDGRNVPGKFCKQWRKILAKKKPKPPTTSITLPTGEPLTVVLIGKTGNGKSAAGNQIIGKGVFEESDRSKSETKSCQRVVRKDEREIAVIDTPGVIDTSTVKRMVGLEKYWHAYGEDQKRILMVLAKMFVYAPQGFNAFILTFKFGTRFTAEDSQALIMLKKFLGKEALDYMILLLTHGDQAEVRARKKGTPIDEYVKHWIDEMETWVKEFVHDELKDRVVLMNGMLEPNEQPEAYKKQLRKLIEEIDKMNKGKKPFVQSSLTDEEILNRANDALRSVGMGDDIESMEAELKRLERQLEDTNDKQQKEEIHRRRDEIKERIKNIQKLVNAVAKNIAGTGCYPGLAIFMDACGRRRRMESLQVGEEVQVITNNEIVTEPVITFIHRQPDVFQQYLKITTFTKKILKITEDHLLFVEKEGEATAIPARDVTIGDTVFVRGDLGALERDAVHNISHVYEKGVYAPVTLSGTILVNDVLTSCYFDVLSHESSNKAMGIARAVYHVSPWMLQWLSSIGQKDGFPGWCRVAHKLLTMID